MFDLSGGQILTFRMVKNGVFVGNSTEGLYLYPLPSMSKLRQNNYDWWRSINT